MVTRPYRVSQALFIWCQAQLMDSHTVVHAQLTAEAAEAVTPDGFDQWDARATTPDGVPRIPRRAAGFVNRVAGHPWTSGGEEAYFR